MRSPALKRLAGGRINLSCSMRHSPRKTSARPIRKQGEARPMSCLAIGVRFHEGRYHGRPEGGTDWPPSPARLFQALVSGAARSETLAETERLALQWLESLNPPLIAAPSKRAGQGFRNFVPNNDLDAVSGDP